MKRMILPAILLSLSSLSAVSAQAAMTFVAPFKTRVYYVSRSGERTRMGTAKGALRGASHHIEEATIEGRKLVATNGSVTTQTTCGRADGAEVSAFVELDKASVATVINESIPTIWHGKAVEKAVAKLAAEILAEQPDDFTMRIWGSHCARDHWFDYDYLTNTYVLESKATGEKIELVTRFDRYVGVEQ